MNTINYSKSSYLHVRIIESESRSVVSDSLQLHGLYSSWNSPGQNTGVGSLALLQRMFSTQESNQGLLHCRQILYLLNHKGSKTEKDKYYMILLICGIFFNGTNGSVQFSRSVVSNSLWPHGLQHTRLPYPSPTPRAYSNSCPSRRWCHPTTSSSVIPFSSWLQSFPASGSFPMSHFFTSGGQSMGASASASVLPMNIQDWFPLGLTSLISFLSKGLSRVFSNTTVQRYQIFSAQLSL